MKHSTLTHTRRRAALLLNTIQHRQYTELCEQLGGHRNDHWVSLAYGHGEPDLTLGWDIRLDGSRIGYGLSRRVHFDLDFESYVLTQVWDHQQPTDGWQFVLLFNTGANDWVPEQVYSWGGRCPSYGEAGAIVDEIEFLRYN